jgi:hypothetical protein
VDLEYNVARWLSGVTHEAPIDPNVVICHASRREALLETQSHLAAIQCSHLHRSDTGLIDIVDDHSGDPSVDHFRDGAGAIGEHRSAARHRLDHDEAKRFRPADRKQQGNGLAQKWSLSFSLISPMNSTPSVDSIGCTISRK